MIDLNTITITSEMLSIISELDEFKGSWLAMHERDPKDFTEAKTAFGQKNDFSLSSNHVYSLTFLAK